MKTIKLFLIFALIGCGNQYYFWDINKFNLTENAITDNTVVQLLYYFEGPFDDEVKDGFYRHAIVTTNNGKDTFNILTFPIFSINSSGISENYIYNNHPTIKNIPGYGELPEDIKKTLNNNQAQWGNYKKVARDPKFDKIADNNYKTLIGSLTKE